MSQNESKRLIKDFFELAEDVQNAVARYLVGRKILEIVEARAHGVTEIEIQYQHKGQVMRLVWDATTNKLLAGSEPRVIDAVLRNLPESTRALLVQSELPIRDLKIKHSDNDDREYLHVHYMDESGVFSQAKLEMDGTPYQKTAKA